MWSGASAPETTGAPMPDGAGRQMMLAQELFEFNAHLRQQDCGRHALLQARQSLLDQGYQTSPFCTLA
jgi:hypothetical protein